MKHAKLIFICLILIFISVRSFAQFVSFSSKKVQSSNYKFHISSIKNIDPAIDAAIKRNEKVRDSIGNSVRLLGLSANDSTTKARIDSVNNIIDSIMKHADPSVLINKLAVNWNDSLIAARKNITNEYINTLAELSKNPKHLIRDSINYYMSQADMNTQIAIDSINQAYSMNKHFLMSARYYRRGLVQLFPAPNANASIRFFTEADTLSSKFFANTMLNYNGSSQKLSFTNETYFDFFGPIRFGLGFALTSASSQTDSAKKNTDDAIQKIIAGGGNINYSLGYPLFSATAERLIIKTKAFFSYKGGVDIPKDSSSSSNYGFINDIGLTVNFYSVGIFKTIQLFESSRISYVCGNKNFYNRLGTADFWLNQNSLGISIKDKFRLRLDYYVGLSSNGFVKQNFPLTISFDISNPF
ncbi:hypothetical protein ACI6Q2_18610 [Chitinophagaceae bacterium LWZ2-11]